MINFKWGYGVVVALAVGVTGCYMDGHRAQHMEPMPMHKMDGKKNMDMHHEAKAGMHKVHASSAKEPAQQVAPGPKRKAAPALPVIQ